MLLPLSIGTRSALATPADLEATRCRTVTDRSAVHEKIALDLTAARSQGRTCTQKDVANGMLGWFL